MKKIKENLLTIVVVFILLCIIILSICLNPKTKQTENSAHSISDLLNEVDFYENQQEFEIYRQP